MWNGRSGIRILFGPLEALIMECLWSHYPDQIKSKEILKEINDNGYNYAITTITTTLARLERKGVIVSTKTQARCFPRYHRSTSSKDEFIRSIQESLPEDL